MTSKNTDENIVPAQNKRRPGILERSIRKLFNVPEDSKQSSLVETVIQRTHMLEDRSKNINNQISKIETVLSSIDIKTRQLSERDVTNLQKFLGTMRASTTAQTGIYGVIKSNAKALGKYQLPKSVPKNKSVTVAKHTPKTKPVTRREAVSFFKGQSTDKLFETNNYPKVDALQSPYVLRQRGQIKVLLLNSIGGSMGRLSKALLAHENIDVDCYVASYLARRQLFYAHETNANGVFSHEEWRDFLKWAVQDYDIIQSSTLPLRPGIAECYDWLTETIGRRHIWRSTGFIHHYMQREDVLPVEIYQNDLNSDAVPDPHKFPCKTFKTDNRYFHTDPNVVFYSSPEKGAYLKGKDTIWLPSIRDPEIYSPLKSTPARKVGDLVKVYVPNHKSALFKGLDVILKTLEALKSEGLPIQIITAETASSIWPDLVQYEEEEFGKKSTSNYPIPNHMMPELLRRVDIVIDQIVMGCYGNTAIEAMMCEKPVIAQKSYDDFDGCPIIEADVSNLKEKISNLIAAPETWVKHGKSGRAYAIRKHRPEHVAKIAADTYRRILDE